MKINKSIITNFILTCALCLLLAFTLTIANKAFARDRVSFTPTRLMLKDMVLKNHRPLSSYSRSREFLIGRIHLESDDKGYFVKDVYCNKIIRKDIGPLLTPDHSIMNVEHTWPQSKFSKRFKKSMQKSDLHHLYPTDYKANGTRGSHYFMDTFGAGGNIASNCESKTGIIESIHQVGFEPPASHKGNVARALFYFAVRYDLVIHSFEEDVLRKWHFEDPADESEIKRNDEIEKLQGNRNPFIDNISLVRELEDF